MSERYDIAIVGAGAAGLVGAEFAASLGVRVALLEADRIGGDCTWTGCVPSKALIRAAGMAHSVRRAALFGIDAGEPRVAMDRVRAWVHGTVRAIYERGTPEQLSAKGMDVRLGPTAFVDAHTLQCGERRVRAQRIVICTGAVPRIPDIQGLADVPYLTYQRFFDLDSLPQHLVVIGAGPLGVEQAQAFARLGARVTLIGPELLPREEPDTRAFLSDILQRDGVTLLRGRARAVRRSVQGLEVTTDAGTVAGDTLLVSAGRRPNTDALQPGRAGVVFSERGITVNRYLQTNVGHIYACGDVIGGPQYSHLAGWQCFQAVRNALLPGRTEALPAHVPSVTFTDPEVARAGMLEREARERHGTAVRVHTWPLSRSDRAVCDGDTDGYLRFITRRDRELLGATVIGSRAGEMIDELSLAMARGITIDKLAGAMHAYPTWTIAVQQFAAAILMQRFGSGTLGRVLRRLGRLTR